MYYILAFFIYWWDWERPSPA